MKQMYAFYENAQGLKIALLMIATLENAGRVIGLKQEAIDRVRAEFGAGKETVALFPNGGRCHPACYGVIAVGPVTSATLKSKTRRR